MPLPDKPILITFDDGYASNYMYAYPILKKLGMQATIFVITDRRGKTLSVNPHFSWNQAREMQDSGVIDIQLSLIHIFLRSHARSASVRRRAYGVVLP